MIRKKKFYFEIFSSFLILFVYCEYIHLYLVLSKCDWPKLDLGKEEFPTMNKTEETLRIMVISDIHLIGPKGVWAEKVLREWEIYHVFHTALNYFQPEVVFILGDSLDEGVFLTSVVFEEYVEKFKNMFKLPEGKTLYTIVGNHDIGFHYEISHSRNKEFVNKFKSPAVEMVTIKGNHFVLINSMALEGDQCSLCQPAMDKLSEIEKILKCAKGTYNGSCQNLEPKSQIVYSEPILMQHFPLYRPSDMECNDMDSAPFPEKGEKFKEAWDCLSKDATFQLLNQIEPRLSLSGHTHHGCTKKLPFGDGIEITIPSINWRCKNNPTIGLGVFTPNVYAFRRCAIPKESTRIILYIIGLSFITFWVIRYKIKSRSTRGAANFLI